MGLETPEHTLRGLFGRDREDPVVTPRTVDVQEVRGVPHLLDAELLHHAQGVGVLGTDADLDAVQADGTEAVVDHQAHRTRRDPATGDLGGDPVADRAPLGRAPGDVADRDLAGEAAPDLDDEGQALPQLGLVQQGPGDDLVRRRARRGTGRDGGVPRPQPVVVAGAHRLPLVGVRALQRPDDHAVRLEPGRPPRDGDQWSLPTTCSTAWRTTGSRTPRPSFTPPREPGRFTTRQSPAIPARPRESIAVGTPLATPAARIASAMPGTSRSSSGAVASGVRSVGVSPVPPVVRTSRAPAATAAAIASRTGSPSGTTTGSPHSKPCSRSQPAISGPVSSA